MLAAIVVGSIALGVMCIGIAATTYYSIIVPRMARKRQRQAQIDQTPPSSYSPYLDQNAGELTTPPLAGEKSMYAAMFVKEDSREMSLSPPCPRTLQTRGKGSRRRRTRGFGGSCKGATR